MPMTPQQWMDLARSRTRGHTDDDLILIALACHDAERGNGDVAAVWHQAAMVTKTKCVCQRCAPGTRYS